MSDDASYTFSFTVQGKDSNLFQVAGFKGHEALSQCYRFDVLLASSNLDLDWEDLMRAKATLAWEGPQGRVTYHGLIFAMNQRGYRQDQALYRVQLMPSLFLLEAIRDHQIFLDKSLDQILEEILSEAGALSHEMRLSGTYPALESVCQCMETHLQFISRWMEKWGIYYFFEQGDTEEKVVFTDTRSAHARLTQSPLRYAPASGLDNTDPGNVVTSMSMERSSVPGSVLMKDYSYLHPNMELRSQAQVLGQGFGEYYIYGGSFQSQTDADKLSKIRAEEILCRETVSHGESSSPSLRPGYLFALEDHPRASMNSEYLVVQVEHEARNRTVLQAGLGRPDRKDQEASYSNTFMAMPSSRQFRPQRLTPVPRPTGMFSGIVDAEGTGQFAQVDDQGRYKIRLPFDLSDRPGAKASCWVRLSRPYAGEAEGMHFPLIKGTEVLLSFVEGDIDRPIIVGAVENAQTQHVVSDKNPYMNVIQSVSGNKVALGDKPGSEFVSLYAPKSNSILALGALVGDDGGDSGGGDGGDKSGLFLSKTDGDAYELVAGAKAGVTLGSKTEVTVGVANELTVGNVMELFAGAKIEGRFGVTVGYSKGNSVELGVEAVEIHDSKTASATNNVLIGGGLSTAGQSSLNSERSLMDKIIGGNVSSAASITGFQTVYGDGGAFADSSCTVKEITSLASGLLGAAGLGATAAGMYKVYSWASSYESTVQTQSTSTLEMGAGGIEINVQQNIPSGGTPKFELSVGVGAPNPGGSPAVTFTPLTCSTMAIEGANGETIEFTNRQTATLSMEKGETIEVQVKDAGNNAASLAIEKGTSLELKVTDGTDTGEVSLAKDSVEVQAKTVTLEGLEAVNINAEKNIACEAKESFSCEAKTQITLEVGKFLIAVSSDAVGMKGPKGKQFNYTNNMICIG